MTNITQFITDGNYDAVRTELVNGYDPNQKIGVYESALECALDYEQFEIAKLLIDFGAILVGYVIVDAARGGDKAFFELLISKGADINAINHVGSSALSRAVGFKNFQGAYALIELGIDLNLVGGQTLVYCAWEGYMDFVTLLLERGIDVNYYGEDQVFSSGVTPLLAAVSGNHIDIAKYLLEHGADITFKDKLGSRAYSIA